MLDRIERIAPVKGTEYDVTRDFSRKKGYDEQKRDKQKFEAVLEKKISTKNVRPDNHSPGVPDAYNLELSIRPTQSLFYQQGADLKEAERKIHDAG